MILNHQSCLDKTLVPQTCERKDMYQEYLDIRGEIALPKTSLLPISAEGQVCEKFGVSLCQSVILSKRYI